MLEMEININDEILEANITDDENSINVEIQENVNMGTDNYNLIKNKPKINGVELVGNKTTEDLGIKVGSDVNVQNEFDASKTHEDNDVYSANITNALTLELVRIIEEQAIFDVYCTISLATMRVTNISAYSATIIEEKNKGKLVRMNCSFAENSVLKVSVLLDVVEGNVASFYPLIVGNIGAGTKNYLFWLQIRANSGNITAIALADEEALQQTVLSVEEFAGNVVTFLGAFNTKLNELENKVQALENKIN